MRRCSLVNMDLISFLIGVPFLIYASYTDIKEGIIPNKLNGALALAAIAILAAQTLINGGHAGLMGLAAAAIGFAAAFGLYVIGGMGGGDVKMIPSLAVLLGHRLYPWSGIDLITNSIICYGPFALVYALALALKRDPKGTASILAEKTAKSLACISVAATVGGYFREIGGGYAAFGASLAALLAVSLALKGRGPRIAVPVATVGTVASFLAGPGVGLTAVGTSIVLALVAAAVEGARKEVTVDELRPGDVPAEVVVEMDGEIVKVGRFKGSLLIASGRAKPVVVPTGEGLTEEDIKTLKELGIDTIRVGTTTPFAPAIAVSYVVTFVVGGSLPSWFSSEFPRLLGG